MCHSEYFSHKNTFILCRVYIRENPVRFNIRQSEVHLKFILRPVPCQLGLLLSLCDTSRYSDEIFFFTLEYHAVFTYIYISANIAMAQKQLSPSSLSAALSSLRACGVSSECHSLSSSEDSSLTSPLNSVPISSSDSPAISRISLRCLAASTISGNSLTYTGSVLSSSPSTTDTQV